MAENGGILGRLTERLTESAVGERLQESAGYTLVANDRLELIEATVEDYRVLSRQLEDIGWQVMGYLDGQPQEMSRTNRKRIVQRARYVWMNDPQAGAAVELMNDFCFGRGVPRPRCKDPKVQEIVDEAWDDPDNKAVLTTLEAQLALGVDLALQSNVYILIFADGEDGRVKLSILRHDDVETIISDKDRRHRDLWYVAKHTKVEWDFQKHEWKAIDPSTMTITPTYYKHWLNWDIAEQEGEKLDDGAPAAALIGEGKVYHLRINRSSEQKMGIPRFQRTLRWYSAYNDFIKARLDVVQAAAAIIMKRKLKATPSQLSRDVSKLVSRASSLAAGRSAESAQMPARPGSILVENESVTHEPLKLDSGSANAMQDAQMIRAPIAAAERWTQAYFGDSSNSNLATATSLELPILKAVESRQEVFERLFRDFIDLVIDRAVDKGKLDKELGDDEIDRPSEDPADLRQALTEAAAEELEEGRELVDVLGLQTKNAAVAVLISKDADGEHKFRIVEAHQDQHKDEASTERDLSYEFGLPSPLRRMMSELIAGVTQIAQTFDPNNTNNNLSRSLLQVALAQGLEMENAAEIVDEVLPKGYVDPMTEAMMAQGAAGAAQGEGAIGQANAEAGGGAQGNSPIADPTSDYRAPMGTVMPEDQRGYGYDMRQSLQESAVPPLALRNRKGEIIWTAPRQLSLLEARDTLPEPTRRQIDGRADELEREFQEDVIDTSLRALDGEHLLDDGK